MWAAQHFGFERPRRWMTSGGLGTMGYGLPAACGVQVAHPDALVVDIAGEASILMNIQELATLAQYGLPVKVFILNNGYMGMVRQWQELLHERRYSASRSDAMPDFNAAGAGVRRDRAAGEPAGRAGRGDRADAGDGRAGDCGYCRRRDGELLPDDTERGHARPDAAGAGPGGHGGGWLPMKAWRWCDDRGDDRRGGAGVADGDDFHSGGKRVRGAGAGDRAFFRPWPTTSTA